jgi:hypothetical protein
LREYCGLDTYRAITSDLRIPIFDSMGVTHIGRPAVLNGKTGTAVLNILDDFLKKEQSLDLKISALKSALKIAYPSEDKLVRN